MISKDTLNSAIKKIRKLPNRDDKVCCVGGVKMLSLDGGGVGRFEVIKILENLKHIKVR